jgi:hypothetical protein
MTIEHDADLTAQKNDEVNSINFGVGVTTRIRRIIARIMLEHGANVNAKNKDGLAPFGLALQSRLAQTLRAVVQHCAIPVATAATKTIEPGELKMWYHHYHVDLYLHLIY